MTHDELRTAAKGQADRLRAGYGPWAEVLDTPGDLLEVLDAIPGLLDDLAEKNRLVELLGALARNQAEPRTKGAER